MKFLIYLNDVYSQYNNLNGLAKKNITLLNIMIFYETTCKITADFISYS